MRGLYAITPEGWEATRLAKAVEAALQGGAALLQYRDKTTTEFAARAAVARALLALCRAHGARLIINDDVDLAARVGADGVHVGRDDTSPILARERLGATAIIGVSCYDSVALAQHAQAVGADYVAFGRFFPSRTKPHAVPVDATLLHTARAAVDLPLCAIGGITAENGAGLIAAGADMLAMVDGLFGEPDIRHAAQRSAALFAAAESPCM